MASADRDPAAVKLPFDTGEYLCTWGVPNGDQGKLEVPGLLTAEPGRYPRGTLYGEMPIEWQSDELATGIASFPQLHSFDTLTGRLSTGAYVALMNGELSYWFETQGQAIGALAVLSQDAFDADEHRKYASIEVQIEGLEAVSGFAPIHSTKFPVKPGADPTWSATVNHDARREWTSDGRKMTFRYDGSFRSADAFEFRMVFGPVLRLESEESLTIVEWWLDWVRPLRQLISLVTNAPREIRYFLAHNGDDPFRAHTDQVFGWDITHAPENSTRAAVRAIKSAINLKEDDLSLLDLLTRWQVLATGRHPLIETYGAMATTQEQHPRSRFLLLLQAIEGLHGYENQEARAKRQEKHTVARDAFIQRAHQSLNKEDLAFLDKYLMKTAPQGLEQALIEVFKGLPHAVTPELEKTKLVAQIRADWTGAGKLRVESALVRARNALSHGSNNFEPDVLEEVVAILDRVVRSEGIRILGAPQAAQERVLNHENR